VICPAMMPRKHFRFQCLGASVQYRSDRVPPGQTEFPLLLCDPKTGDLIERLNFPTVRNIRWALDGPGELALWTGVLGDAWQAGRPRSAVCFGSGKGLVALGGGVWGLTRDE